MGLGSKIFGGALGAIVGGPLGAVVGVGLASLFDDDNGNIEVKCPHCNKKVAIQSEGEWECPYCHNPFTYGDVYSNNEDTLVYFAAAFAIAGKIAKADGVVTKDEIKAVEEFIANLDFDSEKRKFAISAFTEAKDNDVPVEDYLYQFRDLSDIDARDSLLSFLVYLSISDNDLDNNELAILNTAQTIFGLPNDFVEKRLFEYGWSTNNSGSATFNSSNMSGYYEILGISESATMEEVRAAYRIKVKEFHPDKIAAKGLPEEFVNFANDQFNKIQGAYEAIKKQRGE